MTGNTPPDTSTSPAPTTTRTYDADGNLKTLTRPDGNVPGAAAGSYTTTYGYNVINQQTTVTDALSGQTTYAYDDVGNLASVTDPDNNPATYAYNLNHQVTKVTDAAGNVTKAGYDLDGLPVSQTDASNNTTLDTLDPDGQLIQQQVPAQAPGAPVTYDVTQYIYDQAGNHTQMLTPRAVAAGYSTTSSCVATATCPFTPVTKYNPDNQVSAQLSAYDPADPVYNTPSETDYTYDSAGRLLRTSAPPSAGQTIPNITSYTYFKNGWVASTTDPWNITTSYDYTNQGQQSSRTLTSAGGDMTRSQSWGYFPDGKLASVTDNGVPTGLYSELADNSDPGNTSSAGTWTTATTATGFWGSNYQSDINGTASDSFTWNLHVPQDGSYAIYVWYPAVTGAATNASYTITHSGGATTTLTKDQTQNAGTWVKLGTFALSASAANQSVTLAGNPGGTVTADAVKAVSVTTDPNTAHHDLSYLYDADANQTTITDTSPDAAAASTIITYDQLDRLTGVTENNSAGTALHTTTYGYDPASNLKTRTHDAGLTTPSYGAYTYNNLNQLITESDATSATDPSPRVTTFTYTPDGQTQTEVKPNNNQVTYAEPPRLVRRLAFDGTYVTPFDPTVQ